MILAIAAGVIVGAIFGFVASTLILLMRQSRNEKLIERGEPPIRDATHPPLTFPSALVGGAATAIMTFWLPLSVALLFGAVLPVLLVLISAALIGRQLKKRNP